MAKKKTVTIQHKDLGRSAAEHDDKLLNYYVTNIYSQEAVDFKSPVSFFIGRKGAGKSALLQYIRLSQKKLKIDLSADDFALQAIASSELLLNVHSIGDSDEFLYRTIWHYMILLKVIKNISPSKQWFESLRQSLGLKITIKEERRAVIDFLDEAEKLEGDNLTFGQSVLKVMEYLKPKLAFSTPEGISITGELNTTAPDNTKAAISQIYLFKQVYHVIEYLENILGERKLFVLIDDLDLDWKNKPTQNAFIRSLFKAIIRISYVKNIKFVIALREDIFRQIGIDDSDKVRDHIIHMRYNREIILDILKSRLIAVYGVSESNIYDKLFVGNIKKRNPLMYIIDVTNTAREAIQLMQICIEEAAANAEERITEENVLKAEYRYSINKISDLASEFKYQYSDLDAVIYKLKGCKKELSYDSLVQKLEEIILELSYEGRATWIANYYDNTDGIIIMLAHFGIIGIKISRKDVATFFGLNDLVPIPSSENYFAINRSFEKALALV